MDLPGPFRPDGEHVAIDLPGGARALFTTRRGGVSAGPYESLNLGIATGDEARRVEENRKRVARACGVKREHLALTRQVHGADVRRLEGPPPPDLAPDADGQATSAPGVAALVQTADCLPVALAADGAVAMLHAGWRGLAGGVLAEGVRALRDLGATGPLTAAIGPGIGPCCYEVGPEVAARFRREGRTRLDLKAIARDQLEAADVETVHDAGLCTSCAPELFFSHRRDQGRTGRQAGVAWIPA